MSALKNSTRSKWWVKVPLALIAYHLSLLTSLLTSCSTPADDTAAVLIPEDAAVVARFSPADVLRQDASDVRETVSSLMRRRDAGRSLRRLVEKLLSGPLQVGISNDMPVYYYSTLDGEWGLTGSVDSRRKLSNAFTRLASDESLPAIEEHGSFNVLRRDSVLILFSEQFFYLCRTGTAPDALASILEDRVDNGKAWGGNPLFDHLISMEGDIQLLVTGKALAAACNLGTISRALPDDTALANLDLLADVSLAQGEATIAVTLLPQSDGWQEFISRGDGAALPLKTSQARFMPADGLTLLVNTDGAALYDALASIARASNAADEGTLSQLRGVCGEVSGTMEANISPDGSLCAYMATTDTFLTHLVRELVLSDDSTITMAPAQYAFDLDTLSRPSSFFGRDHGQTYLATGGRQPFSPPSPALSESLVKGRGFYLNAEGSYFSDSCLLRRFTQTQAYYNGDGRVVIVLSAGGYHTSPIAAFLDTE